MFILFGSIESVSIDESNYFLKHIRVSTGINRESWSLIRHDHYSLFFRLLYGPTTLVAVAG